MISITKNITCWITNLIVRPLFLPQHTLWFSKNYSFAWSTSRYRNHICTVWKLGRNHFSGPAQPSGRTQMIINWLMLSHWKERKSSLHIPFPHIIASSLVTFWHDTYCSKLESDKITNHYLKIVLYMQTKTCLTLLLQLSNRMITQIVEQWCISFSIFGINIDTSHVTPISLSYGFR